MHQRMSFALASHFAADVVTGVLVAGRHTISRAPRIESDRFSRRTRRAAATCLHSSLIGRAYSDATICTYCLQIASCIVIAASIAF